MKKFGDGENTITHTQI